MTTLKVKNVFFLADSANSKMLIACAQTKTTRQVDICDKSR